MVGVFKLSCLEGDLGLVGFAGTFPHNGSCLPSCPAQAAREGPLTAPHSAGTPLIRVVWGARDSEETEEEASGVLEVLEAGPTLGAELITEGLVGQAEGRSMLEG
ncbi:hypothetical protein BHM03_00055968 [Ensete ventricosum]|nr:hypothetical protein BHM03_00055968 [Ensete ventricosum]